MRFSVSHNEMEWLEVSGAIPSSELHLHADRAVQVAGVAVAGRRHMGRDSKWMLFLSLQDRDGLIEVVLFPDAYQKSGKVLADGGHWRKPKRSVLCRRARGSSLLHLGYAPYSVGSNVRISMWRRERALR
ncbi:MAG TPA: hypothetical protein VJ183_15185 [Chloroflexia bacterium]|nr:hypothetical protein [Chloroflexia bacterium]